MNRNRFLSAALAFVACPGRRFMPSMPASTNEVAALGSAVAAGVVQLFDNGDTTWGDGVGGVVQLDTGLGVRPKAIVLQINEQTPFGGGIPVRATARTNPTGALVLPITVAARTTNGSLASTWASVLNVHWIAIA